MWLTVYEHLQRQLLSYKHICIPLPTHAPTYSHLLLFFTSGVSFLTRSCSFLLTLFFSLSLQNAPPEHTRFFFHESPLKRSCSTDSHEKCNFFSIDWKIKIKKWCWFGCWGMIWGRGEVGIKVGAFTGENVYVCVDLIANCMPFLIGQGKFEVSTGRKIHHRHPEIYVELKLERKSDKPSMVTAHFNAVYTCLTGQTKQSASSLSLLVFSSPLTCQSLV